MLIPIFYPSIWLLRYRPNSSPRPKYMPHTRRYLLIKYINPTPTRVGPITISPYVNFAVNNKGINSMKKWLYLRNNKTCIMRLNYFQVWILSPQLALFFWWEDNRLRAESRGYGGHSWLETTPAGEENNLMYRWWPNMKQNTIKDRHLSIAIDS